jgi:hypothetical protein
MTLSLRSVFLLVAVVLFAVGALYTPGPRLNIVSAGLAFLALGLLLP